ncbi:bifunctional nicotinamidase/pyrazinamidase [Actomonas aquatica]|uniref:nicotinamidase n=1 Tax=Actomonas aquatica TaxID=2866162 RepID=A0ABZ1C232_9BACT|nr:bifunctional nicotinamidase/pyrazinamidase [Opitutus sp. WL0086]WRQ85709.1 bifunctional nicotinamidase/pyrazinamidase [Opitutus sp. WL0086]
MKTALILVDLQNDFLPGGALGVPGGDAVIPVANALMDSFDVVAATQDWHPADHGSFAANHAGAQVGDLAELGGLPQVLWPVHCMQDTPGAAFAPELNAARIAAVFPKGTDVAIDSYSGFQDNGGRRQTGLADYLQAQGVTDVAVMGLATDYCVKATAIDAVAAGFRVTLVTDGCRGVDLADGDVERALAAMVAAGVRLTDSKQLLEKGLKP